MWKGERARKRKKINGIHIWNMINNNQQTSLLYRIRSNIYVFVLNSIKKETFSAYSNKIKHPDVFKLEKRWGANNNNNNNPPKTIYFICIRLIWHTQSYYTTSILFDVWHIRLGTVSLLKKYYDVYNTLTFFKHLIYYYEMLVWFLKDKAIICYIFEMFAWLVRSALLIKRLKMKHVNAEQKYVYAVVT